MSITGDLSNNTRAVVNGLPATGDIYDHVEKKAEGVMFVNFPTAPHINLEKGGNAINRFTVSGKQLGAAVIGYTDKKGAVSAELYFATGKGEQDKWMHSHSLVGAGSRHISPDAPVKNTSVIGDQPAIHDTEYEGTTFMSLDLVIREDMLNAAAPINQHSISGKRIGTLVLVHNQTGRAVYAASGSAPTDSWAIVGTIKEDATLTPVLLPVTPSSHPSTSVIGDCSQVMKNKQGVILSAIPVYHKDDGFLTASSVVNTTKLSGKRMGSMCVIRESDTVSGLYMAAGDEPASHWIVIARLSGAAASLIPTAV